MARHRDAPPQLDAGDPAAPPAVDRRVAPMRRSLAAVLALVLLVAASSGGGDDEAEQTRRFFRGADCATLRATLDQSDLAASLAGPADPTPALEETARFLRGARGRTPESLAADVRVLTAAYAALAKGAHAVDWAAIARGDAMATIPASRLGRRLADPQFGAAAFAVARAATTACPA
jgi:hypothetical protein